MYLSKIIKTANNTYVYDALNNTFAVIDPETDILNDENDYTEFLQNTN